MTKGKTKDGLEYLWTDKKRTLFGLPLSFTRYYLTESRLITRIGLLTVVEDELDIYRITDKKMELPLGQRLFGCGTIILFSKDVDTPEKHIHSIKNPDRFPTSSRLSSMSSVTSSGSADGTWWDRPACRRRHGRMTTAATTKAILYTLACSSQTHSCEKEKRRS